MLSYLTHTYRPNPTLRSFATASQSSYTTKSCNSNSGRVDFQNRAALTLTDNEKVRGIFAELQEVRFSLARVDQARFTFDDFKVASVSLKLYFEQLKFILGCYSKPGPFVYNNGNRDISKDVSVLLENGCKPTPELLFDLLLFPHDLGPKKEDLFVQLATHLDPKDVNKKDDSFLELLHYAVFLRYNELAVLLKKMGGNVSGKDHLGLSPEDIALWMGNRRLIGEFNQNLDPKGIEELISRLNMNFMVRCHHIFAYTADNRENKSFRRMITNALPNLRNLGHTPLEEDLKYLYAPWGSVNGKTWAPTIVAINKDNFHYQYMLSQGVPSNECYLGHSPHQADLTQFESWTKADAKFLTPMSLAFYKGDHKYVEELVKDRWHMNFEEEYSRQSQFLMGDDIPLPLVSFDSSFIENFKGDPNFFKEATKLIFSCGLSDEMKKAIEIKQKYLDLQRGNEAKAGS